MIVVIDLRIGNVGSILNMLKKVGAKAITSASPDDLASADKLIFPGIGAFDDAMNNLDASGLRPVLEQTVLDQETPILGICLGMQLFTQGSEEGHRAGLGWIAGYARRFRFEGGLADLKVPHMGWNEVQPRHRGSLFRDMDAEAAYYFAHTFHVVCDDNTDVLGSTRYGIEFVSAVQRRNIYGTQFHPEKSHRHGLRLLQSFAELA